MVKFACSCGASVDHPDDDKRVSCPQCRKSYDVVWTAENVAELRPVTLTVRASEAAALTFPVLKFLILSVLVNIGLLFVARFFHLL